VAHTLLLADDSVTIQRVIELTFADEDVQVVAVSDGDQAIARLESAPPDIVLADIGMPGRNGYEVARYVKQSPKLSHIPVVLLTGAFEPVDQARASEVGCDGVLAKPFEPQLVIGRVKELLAADMKKASAAAPAAVSEPPAETPATTPEARAELDDYFDRLDVAFQKLSASSPLPLPIKIAKPAEPDVPSVEPNVPAPEPPVTYASPPPAVLEAPVPGASLHEAPKVEAPVLAAPVLEARQLALERPVEHVEHVRPVAVDRPAPAGTTRPLPSLGDAFAAILAAEGGEASDGRPGWPASFAIPEPTIEVTDEIIDRVVGRVIERLSDRVVRDTTREVVAQVAERLVRDEIDRIKSALK
jgi:CheY-like chemotaxis protein